jgi:hypothetical protein
MFNWCYSFFGLDKVNLIVNKRENGDMKKIIIMEQPKMQIIKNKIINKKID